MFELLKLAEQKKEIFTEIMPWQIAVSELEYDSLDVNSFEVKQGAKVIAKWDSQLNEGWILETFKSKVAAVALGAAAISSHAGLNVATTNALNQAANNQAITATSQVYRLKIDNAVYSRTDDTPPSYAKEYKVDGRVFKYWENNDLLSTKKFKEIK